MRRVRKVKRGRWLSLLVAAFIGYLLGGWHTAGSHSPDLSASQNVALRFPEADAEAAAVDAADETSTGTTSNTALKQARLALLSPLPMAPVSAVAPSPPAPASETVASLPPAEVAPMPRPVPAAVPRSEAQSGAVPLLHAVPKLPTAATAEQHVSRPEFLLNDVQIASIKQRLHLSPDQDRMWPAVEAALRNVAYAKTHYARRHGPVEGAGGVASLDSNSAEVQGLKSAAIPLIMSFSDQQKSEVRSLAHVMGLDKLAAEF
jgi:hypothetical protein